MTNMTAELKAQFLRLYAMAIADDDFSALELKMLYQFAKERDVPKSELDQLLTNPVVAINVPEGIHRRVAYLYDLARMIWADEIVTEDEILTLKKYCRKFEFIDENIDELSAYLIESAKQNKTITSIYNELKISKDEAIS